MSLRYFIQIAFDGTRYHGWQSQKNAHTVQAELESALMKVFRVKTDTLGAGRTDTGVHASTFFAHFDVKGPLPPKLIHSLNSILPHDISVQDVIHVKGNAHARFDAISRTYKYQLYQEKNPFLRGRACFYPQPLDLKLMAKASEALFSYHDFSCFSKSRTDVKTNLCKISEASWKKEKDKLVFTITADRFLRGMVRAIVGTVTDVGKGKISLDDFKKIIENKNRRAAGESVDPCGLYLTDVRYDWKKIKI